MFVLAVILLVALPMVRRIPQRLDEVIEVAETAGSISHVSESARQAYDFSDNARQSSDQGNQVVHNMVESMKEIARESTKLRKNCVVQWPTYKPSSNPA